jgi:hypothetical protein
MIRLLAITLFSVLPILGNSQLIPEYFKSIAFKAWISENRISSLTAHTQPSENLSYTSGYYLAKGGDFTFISYSNPYLATSFETKIGVYEYLFDEFGNLDSMCIKVMKITCKAPEKDSFHLNADFRSRLNELIKTDYSAQFRIDTTGESKFNRAQTSKILQQCRFKNMNYFFDPSGHLWTAINQEISIPGLKGTQVLTYRIVQTIKFKNEEPVTIKKYHFDGDFWEPNYEYWSLVNLNDSVQAVKIESSVYTENYGMPRGLARDTSYYANTFIHHANETKTFYTTDTYFDTDLSTFPRISLTTELNEHTFLYENFYKNFPNIPYSFFPFQIFEDWNYLEGFQKFEIAEFTPGKNILKRKEYFKRDTWVKTEIYDYWIGEEHLFYTEIPYENGVKRVYNEKYKANKRTLYFEHKGKEFKVYNYYPGSKRDNKTKIEARTNNGCLEIGNFDAEYPGDVLKMTIGYR